MWSYLATLLGCFAVLVQLTTGEGKSLLDVPDSNENERIIGGRNAAKGMFPWTVALFYKNQFICTASVISQNYVLTAAHCVTFNGVVQSASDYYGIAGNVNKSSPVVRLNFVRVVPHPDYDNSVNNDLALFQTDNTITFSDNLKPICIAAKDTATDDMEVLIMGWGRTNRIRFLPTQIPDILQYAKQRTVPNQQCEVIYGEVNDMKLCANGLATGVCNGDSGGPLVLMKNSPVEIGIVSYGNGLIGCGKFFGPAVFTRVSAYNDFIMETTGGGVCSA